MALALPIIFFHGSLSAGHSRHPGCSFSLARAAWANFSASCSSSSLRVSSTLPHTSSLSCPLITSSFRCTIFSDIVFEWCVATSFYQCSVTGCRKSGLRHFFEVFIAPLRLRRGQGAMQGNPCYARHFADLPYMPPNPMKA